MRFSSKIMVSAHLFWLAPLLIATSCRSRESSSQTRAVRGQPTIYLGLFNTSTPSLDFYDMDPSTHRAKVDANGNSVVLLSRKITGGGLGSGISIEGDKFGQPLGLNPAATYSWFTNTPWKCGSTEEFVTGVASTASDKDENCYFEITTTGNSGFALAIIGLGADGKGGLADWINDTKPAVKAGALHKVSDGLLKPGEINTMIDAPAVLLGMQNLQKKYPLDGSRVTERNTCLKNALAADWQDIQAHYYCQITLDYRTCYATQLIEARKKGAADPSNQLFKNPFAFAYDQCFKGNNVLPAGDETTFQYVMYTKIGALDFNIEAANDVINQFYGVTQPDPATASYDGDKRPRRIVDTYPAWLSDQPRYNKIRQRQQDGQKAFGI